MRHLTLILLLLCTRALAVDLTVNVPGLKMRLTTGQCLNPQVLQHIAPQHHQRFRAAEVVIDEKRNGACWVDEGATLTIFLEDGSGGRLPKSMFDEQHGA